MSPDLEFTLATIGEQFRQSQQLGTFGQSWQRSESCPQLFGANGGTAATERSPG